MLFWIASQQNHPREMDPGLIRDSILENWARGWWKFEPARRCYFSSYLAAIGASAAKQAVYQWYHRRNREQVVAACLPECFEEEGAIDPPKISQLDGSEECRRALPYLLDQLKPRHAKVLAAFYGVDRRPVSATAIALALGISKSRVHQMRHEAIWAVQRLLHRCYGRLDLIIEQGEAGAYPQRQWQRLSDKEEVARLESVPES